MRGVQHNDLSALEWSNKSNNAKILLLDALRNRVRCNDNDQPDTQVVAW
jgi:hypothetical protein